MKRKIAIVSFLMGAMFVFSGCAGSSHWVNAYTKNNDQMHMNQAIAKEVEVDNHPNRNFKDEDNVKFQCSNALMLNAFSTKAIEKGYSYFTIEFNQGSTKSVMAVNRTEQHLRYCNAPYYDASSELLEDKCRHVGLGNGNPLFMRDVTAHFFKQRNPLVPTWDAVKTKRETMAILQNQCYRGEPEKLSFLIGEYSKIQEK